MRSEPVDPLSLEEFKNIVEGKRRCPTVLELSALAEQARRGPVTSPLLQHLEKCADCRERYEQLRAPLPPT